MSRTMTVTVASCKLSQTGPSSIPASQSSAIVAVHVATRRAALSTCALRPRSSCMLFSIDDGWKAKRRIVVAMTGATGAIYGVRLLRGVAPRRRHRDARRDLESRRY